MGTCRRKLRRQACLLVALLLTLSGFVLKQQGWTCELPGALSTMNGPPPRGTGPAAQPEQRPGGTAAALARPPEQAPHRPATAQPEADAPRDPSLTAEQLAAQAAEGYRQRLLRENPLYSDKVINPHPFAFVREPAACHDAKAGRAAPEEATEREVFLLVLVMCRPQEVRDRRWIRHTWGAVRAYKGARIDVRFLVGQSPQARESEVVRRESALYGDLIQGDFADTYRNLTHKALMGLRWAALRCPGASFVASLDSDMFLNVFRLVDRLRSLDERRLRNYAEGNLKGVTKPMREVGKHGRFSRWHTPLELYPEPTYPPYLNGPAYVMTGDLPVRIFNTSAHVRWIPWDDVFIGLVMKRLRTRLAMGTRYEVRPKSFRPDAFLQDLTKSTAVMVGHRLSDSFVLKDVWHSFLAQYQNFTYAPPHDGHTWLNTSRLVE